MTDKINEECGVFGIYQNPASAPDAASFVYYGLFALQHRGQEGCGITVNNCGVFTSFKDIGLVNDVFTPERLAGLGEGRMAVGHVRYGTTGGNSRENCQPMEIRHLDGKLALVHNGNLTNAYEIRRELELKGAIFHTTSDTEVISFVVTQELLKCASLEEALSKAMDRLEGAYSLVMMSRNKLIAVRDENGFRPLCVGMTDNGDYVFASESCALDTVGARLIKELLPGEIFIIDENGISERFEHCGKRERALCIFEYIYFSRPDSVVEGVSVHRARMNAGRYLAKEYPVNADVVIGVPDSGIDAAIGYSQESGIPYGIGFIKNKYIGRTFIAPGQEEREDKVKIKLNPLSDTVKGKRVIVVDDSIVRGTTSARIINLIRGAGATEVHMRISAPPFISPCYYGTDIDSKDKLIACNYSIPEITKMIGADSLGYLLIEDLMKITGTGKGYCTACFTEDYPTATPDAESGKDRFEELPGCGKIKE